MTNTAAYLQHEEWLAKRSQISAAPVAKALEILNRPSKRQPEPGDELPKGYIPVGTKRAHKSRRVR